MVAAGVALDVAVLHRLLPYQPGWAALPVGAAELALTMLAARALGVTPPLEAALAFFAAAWLVAQVLGHAVYPLAHHRYGDDGGELGRAGPAVLALSPCSRSSSRRARRTRRGRRSWCSSAASTARSSSTGPSASWPSRAPSCAAGSASPPTTSRSPA